MIGILARIITPHWLTNFVLALGTKDRKYGKWSPTWHGPYKVDQVLPENVYMLEELDGVKFPVAINGQHLKKYFTSMWEGE